MTESRLTPAERKRILKIRARELAREPEKEGDRAESRVEFIEFLLGGERYGVETAHVREVYPLKEITPLPGAPPFVMGIVYAGGEVVSVLDLRKLLGFPGKGLAEVNEVVVLRNERMRFGILTEGIRSIGSVPRALLQPPPPTLAGTRGEFALGMTAERVLLLDGAAILADSRLVVREEADP